MVVYLALFILQVLGAVGMTYEYKTGLYDPPDTFTAIRCRNREEWLARRKGGITGTGAPCVIGANPWRSNVEYWEIKTGRKEEPDLSGNEAVRLGTELEETIRQLFAIRYRDTYEMHYIPNAILQNNDYKHLLYSPDGLLQEIGTSRRGLWECKTHSMRGKADRELWKDRVPSHYFYQVLHGLAVTGFDFAIITAALMYSDDYTAIKNYTIEAADFRDEIEDLTEASTDFWRYNVQAGRKPNRVFVI